MDEKLSERKHTIIISAVEDYISSALPITSSAVQQKHLSEISSATLRNELNALEAMGFLKQLHTSSGRVPTSKGYRYYVNNLLNGVKIKASDLESVQQILDQRASNISDIISEIAKIVSKATNYPTVVVSSGYDMLEITGVTVIPLAFNQALVLIKTPNGMIHNNIVLPAVSPKECEDASNFLSKKFEGKTIGYLLENMDKIESEMQSEIMSFKTVLDNVIVLLKQLAQGGEMNVRREGSVKLLTDAGSLSQTKNILEMLDDENGLKSIVETDSKGITMLSGEDLGENMEGCAVVKAPIIIGGKKVASVGVLGPERMDYTLIAGALKLVTEEISTRNLLEKGDKDVKKRKR